MIADAMLVRNLLVQVADSLEQYGRSVSSDEIRSAYEQVKTIDNLDKALDILESETESAVSQISGMLAGQISDGALSGLSADEVMEIVGASLNSVVSNNTSTYEVEFTYLNKDGNPITFMWRLSDEEFINANILSQEQITEICMKMNPGLVERNFDKEIYRMCNELGVSPKVILATLGQEQNWCKNGKYDKAFGVGPGGTPNSYSDDRAGGLAESIKAYIKRYNEGLAIKEKNGGELQPMLINRDCAPYKETTAVFKEKTAEWQDAHKEYVEYMEKGLVVTPVNCAMYAKLRYTPWVDFPPQNSQPLKAWMDIYNNLDNLLED